MTQDLKIKIYLKQDVNLRHKHCDQMAKYLLSIWPFKTMKICPKPKELGSKCCQLIKALEKHPYTYKIHQNGELSADLATN